MPRLPGRPLRLLRFPVVRTGNAGRSHTYRHHLEQLSLFAGDGMTAPSLDELLSGPETIVVPGAYDALSARIAVRAGARAVYMSGFGIAGASFGVPDIGLLGPDQMSDRVRAIASAVAPVPLLADGDTGYGGPAHVARLVHDYERAGAAAIQIESQVSPKSW